MKAETLAKFQLTIFLAADGQIGLQNACSLRTGFPLREQGLHASYQAMRAVKVPSSEAVRAAMVASLRRGDATLDSTARALKISARTLQRHLGHLGTSHSEILAEVRLGIACSLLADSTKRLSDIAKILGYANASSFSRSFARLMKIQPVVYRRQQLARKQEIMRPRGRPHAIVR